jgi:hypothetical protein
MDNYIDIDTENDISINSNTLYLSIFASIINIGVCLVLLYRHVQ